jgi:hypothetical protein
MPSTVRIELNKASFDWKNGIILVGEDKRHGSSAKGANLPRLVSSTDALLDQVFSNGNGILNIPKIFARDAKAVYFAYANQVSGTKIVRVAINPEAYLKQKESIPYPGND